MWYPCILQMEEFLNGAALPPTVKGVYPQFQLATCLPSALPSRLTSLSIAAGQSPLYFLMFASLPTSSLQPPLFKAINCPPGIASFLNLLQALESICSSK